MVARSREKPAAVAAVGALSSLGALAAAGAFVSDQPVKQTITWSRAHKGLPTVDLDVWIRPMNAADFESLMRLPAGTSRMAATVATLVSFGPTGDEKLTAEQADTLDPFLVLAMTEAINRVTPEGKA